ncbi:MAG: D-Ala-D-Ala carboxypeptidase family metallohydrolase [Cyanobacteria bacterium P01_E01_bin.6]
MRELAPDQRNYFYVLEAVRVGIHKSILAALYEVHHAPRLPDGEYGLGIAPANRIPLSQLDTFPEQVQYAANTIRGLTDALIQQGWDGEAFWNARESRYSDTFLQRVADGYRPSSDDAGSGLLESSDYQSLKTAYLEDMQGDFEAAQLPQSLASLDRALLDLVERLPRYYQGVTHQREALLDAMRIWRKANTREEIILSLLNDQNFPTSQADLDRLDRGLLNFIQNVSPYYAGYPHERESLLRLTQLWRRLNTREDAIASLSNSTSPEPGLDIVDPALIALVQRIPEYYRGQGRQRTALLEGFRMWRGLDSRKKAIAALGIETDIFTTPLDPDRAQAIAQQIDRELVAFIRRIPGAYGEKPEQREALLRLAQLWRQLGMREAVVQSLLDDVKRMERERPAPPRPTPPLMRPPRWTPSNIQLSASIIANGNFTWAEATRGGQRMPNDQATVNAMVRIAGLAQQARDRIGRPFIITSWYRPPAINRQVGGSSSSRHIVGDAIDYYVEGMTGDQLYRLLDPWWPGGLGRYGGNRFLISHIDARGHRARWRHS